MRPASLFDQRLYDEALDYHETARRRLSPWDRLVRRRGEPYEGFGRHCARKAATITVYFGRMRASHANDDFGNELNPDEALWLWYHGEEQLTRADLAALYTV